MKHSLRRAVEASGDTLGIPVQTSRNAKAAKRFLRKMIAYFGQPRGVIADKLRSDMKPIARQAPDAGHRAHKALNIRIEGSHRSTRQREKVIGRFEAPKQAQRFLAAQSQINAIFKPRRKRPAVNSYLPARADAFCLWTDYAREMTAWGAWVRLYPARQNNLAMPPWLLRRVGKTLGPAAGKDRDANCDSPARDKCRQPKR